MTSTVKARGLPVIDRNRSRAAFTFAWLDQLHLAEVHSWATDGYLERSGAGDNSRLWRQVARYYLRQFAAWETGV